jgi:hypothetical protein
VADQANRIRRSLGDPAGDLGEGVAPLEQPLEGCRLLADL